MKKWMRASIAMLLALVLLGSFAFAEGRVVSDPFRLPEVKVPQAEQPSEEQPAEEQPSEEQPAEEQPEQSGPAAVIGSAVVALENEGSSLNVRAAASADSERVGSLAHGEAVSVLGYSGDWTHIRTSAGTEGYVLSSYLTDSIAEPPAEETPAEETPAEETPAEELPTEELPAEELPAEETPAEELPTEETPAEEIPDDGLIVEEGLIADNTPEPAADPGTQIAEIIDAEYAGRVVRIYANWDQSKEYLELGDSMVFTAVLEGYDGLTYQLQWQTSPTGDGSWSDISGATGLSYTLVLSEQNYDDFFRAVVNVTGLAG
ncbi:SH3 domain-containing protein [Anaerotruncus massiliensis (ex Liu et al. 2021)]|uniref:SH3 domain-containing protein n=1 Tax=Anaerotruncus massiliensis (ex Liu et al. 2021) TaxID=2321404 RepID=UPI003A8C526A